MIQKAPSSKRSTDLWRVPIERKGSKTSIPWWKIRRLIDAAIGSWGWVIDQSLTKTHAEMEALRLASGFIPGQSYTITDVETKYLDPLTNTLFTWAVEQLNTRAISVNQLAEDVYSLSHPNDIISYELASQNIGIGFNVFEDWQGAVPNTTDLTNVSSFAFTTGWFWYNADCTIKLWCKSNIHIY